VDKAVAGYDGFKILMNMSAMSKGTPAAGVFVMRTMKKYPLEALALYGANGFMRGMARTVLGLARFSNFELFDDEAAARRWLERSGDAGAGAGAVPASGPAGSSTGRLRRLVVPAGLLASAVIAGRRRRRRRAAAAPPAAG